ncbi:hypothetical protein ACQKWADRAFT_321649 [Trichoderma austrokoningii]
MSVACWVVSEYVQAKRRKRVDTAVSIGHVTACRQVFTAPSQLHAQMRPRCSILGLGAGALPINSCNDVAGAPKRPRYSHLDEPVSPVGFWAKEGRWPQQYFEPESESEEMENILARRKSLSTMSRKRSSPAMDITPSDQRPREEKSAPYADARPFYLGPTDASKRLVRDLLDGAQPVPEGTIFDDEVFEEACLNLEGMNEARIIQDISRLIVPSVETAALRTKALRWLVESVNEGWNNSVPLTGPRPQPDYSVGFKREAFSDDQLAKLSPFIGDFILGDQSFFMATYYMYFPFLTCEVKCGATALEVADRQNAHSMTLAVRAVTALFRTVNREAERHPIHAFSFTALDGKERWTAYRFIKNICSAINQLPDLDFSLKSHHLSQSDAESPGINEESQLEVVTPSTSFADQGTSKRDAGNSCFSARTRNVLVCIE